MLILNYFLISIRHSVHRGSRPLIDNNLHTYCYIDATNWNTTQPTNKSEVVKFMQERNTTRIHLKIRTSFYVLVEYVWMVNMRSLHRTSINFLQNDELVYNPLIPIKYILALICNAGTIMLCRFPEHIYI